MKKRYEVVFACEVPPPLAERLYRPEDFYYCLIEFDGDTPVRIVGQDGGAPEDQLLVRDWAWVAVELNAQAARIAELEVPTASFQFLPDFVAMAPNKMGCADNQHKKVYSPNVLMSYPPSYAWICSECDGEGTDRGGYSNTPSYDDLVRRKRERAQKR